MPLKKRVSVTLDPRVIEYVEQSRRKQRLSRSFLIETAVIEHAEKNGVHLDLFSEEPPAPQRGHQK